MLATAYAPEAWGDFGVAVAGATAALAGLLVVAISINVKEILSGAGLPARAGGALALLTLPLVIAVFAVIPDQSAKALGWELVGLATVAGVGLGYLVRPRRRPGHGLTSWIMGTSLPVGVAVISTLLAGIGLLTTSLGGLYWLPVTVIAAILGGLGQAWILLIEILR